MPFQSDYLYHFLQKEKKKKSIFCWLMLFSKVWYAHNSLKNSESTFYIFIVENVEQKKIYN